KGVPSGFSLPAPLAERLSHRQFGVGCDQILWLQPAEKAGSPKGGAAKARVVIVNSDGSEAEMCGNGMRAIGVFLQESGETRFRVDTASGPVEIDLADEYPSVRLGVPKVIRDR